MKENEKELKKFEKAEWKRVKRQEKERRKEWKRQTHELNSAFEHDLKVREAKEANR